MIICISGTPGTGKTTLSKRLGRILKAKVINGNFIIKKYRLSEGRDKIRNCAIVDRKKFVASCLKECKDKKQNYILDSHLSHNLQKKNVAICIVCKTELSELNKRLCKRKYSVKKIRENLDAEIFDVCLEEAREKGHKIIIWTKNKPVKNLASDIRNTIFY